MFFHTTVELSVVQLLNTIEVDEPLGEFNYQTQLLSFS